MSNDLKAHGGDDAGALVSVRDWDPNRTNNSKKQFRSQLVLVAYRVDQHSLVSGIFRMEARNE